MEARIGVFVHHVPRLIELIEKESVLDKVIGGVYLRLYDNGALGVTWLEEGEDEGKPVKRSETLLL